MANLGEFPQFKDKEDICIKPHKLSPVDFFIAEPSAEIVGGPSGEEALELIEQAARVCYQSQDRIEEGSAEELIKRLIKVGHWTPFEHVSISVRFVVDRATHASLIRHRLAAHNVESTRYCRYTADRFSGKLTLIEPMFKSEEALAVWVETCADIAEAYDTLIALGEPPEAARSVLPLSLKVEMMTTANVREWRHIFKLRTDQAAHPQVRSLMTNLLEQFREEYPILFDDI